jgi:hypothetical protein
MNPLKKLWRKLITTEPVVYLDIFKGAILIGGATGFFVVDDNRAQALYIAIPAVLTPLLTWLTRSSVVSQVSFDNVTETYPRVIPTFQELKVE